MALKIEIEGVDGSGKTTALEYFIEQLNARDKSVLETREVGSPLIPINVELRKTVLSPDSGLSGEAMELIFAAMRFENDRLYNQVGKDYDFIVSDRGWLSHLAYTDHNVSEKFTNDLYLQFLAKYTQMPDVVLYFSVNTETALKRRISRSEGMDVIEMKGVEFQEKVRKSFERYVDDTSLSNTTVFFVNANQDIQGVRSQIDEIVKYLIP